MIKTKSVILVVFIFVLGCSRQVNGPDTAGVQAAMKGFIEERMAGQGGAYSIKGVSAEFDYLHDGVDERDGLFVSCADFKAGDDVYDIDYYVKAEGGVYTVVREVLHKRNKEEVGTVLWRLGG
jgi:hypothetical protein